MNLLKNKWKWMLLLFGALYSIFALNFATYALRVFNYSPDGLVDIVLYAHIAGIQNFLLFCVIGVSLFVGCDHKRLFFLFILSAFLYVNALGFHSMFYVALSLMVINYVVIYKAIKVTCSGSKEDRKC